MIHLLKWLGDERPVEINEDTAPLRPPAPTWLLIGGFRKWEKDFWESSVSLGSQSPMQLSYLFFTEKFTCVLRYISSTLTSRPLKETAPS